MRPDEVLAASVDRREGPHAALRAYRAARARLREQRGWWSALAGAFVAGGIWGALLARLWRWP